MSWWESWWESLATKLDLRDSLFSLSLPGACIACICTHYMNVKKTMHALQRALPERADGVPCIVVRLRLTRLPSTRSLTNHQATTTTTHTTMFISSKTVALVALALAAPALGARTLKQVEVDPRCVETAPEGYGASTSIEMFGLQCSGCPVGEEQTESGFRHVVDPTDARSRAQTRRSLALRASFVRQLRDGIHVCVRRGERVQDLERVASIFHAEEEVEPLPRLSLPRSEPETKRQPSHAIRRSSRFTRNTYDTIPSYTSQPAGQRDREEGFELNPRDEKGNIASSTYTRRTMPLKVRHAACYVVMYL